MKINDIDGKNIKLSKNSITVIGDNGKTAGIVRDINPYLSLQANKRVNYWHLLRDVGIWGNPKQIVKYTLVIDSQLYQLRNLNPYKYYTDEEKASEDLFYANIESNGIKVVNVYLYR